MFNPSSSQLEIENAKVIFRLGEQVPRSSSSGSTFFDAEEKAQTSAWGDYHSKIGDDLPTVPPGIVHFADCAAEAIAVQLRTLAKEYEHRLRFPGNRGSASSFSDTMSSMDDASVGAVWSHFRQSYGSLSSMQASPGDYLQLNNSMVSPSEHGSRAGRGMSPMAPVVETGCSSSAASSMDSPAEGGEEALPVQGGASNRSLGMQMRQEETSDTSEGTNYHSSVRPQQDRLPEWIKKSLRNKASGLDGRGPKPRWRSTLSSLFTGRTAASSVRQAVKRIRNKRSDRKGGRWIERVWAALAALNAVFVCWELQYFVTHEEVPKEMNIVSLGFAAVFSIELFFRCRAVSFRLHQVFAGPDASLNILDMLVVSFLWVEVSLRLALTDMPSWVAWDVSLLRIMRFLGLMAKVSSRMESLREIRILARVIMVALRSWFWIIVFSSCLIYFCSVVLSHGAHPLCNPEDGSDYPESHQALCRHFGDFGRTFGTFYKATFGGLLWGELVDAMAPAPMQYQIFLVASVIFGVIIIANLTTGVLVEVHADGKRHDIECMMHEEERNTKLFIHSMQHVFQEIDTNRSGAISRAELELALDDPDMNALLRCHNLEMHDAHLLFNLLDSDGSNSIDVEEFIAGCLKMKGAAQAIDIVRLQMQMDEILSAGYLRVASQGQQPGRGETLPGARDNRYVSSSSARARALTDVVGSGLLKTSSLPDVPSSLRDVQLHLLTSQSTYLSTMTPAWRGGKVARSEERAMLLHELRVLMNHIKLNCSLWIEETTRNGISKRKVNMYDVNYNWICPLTVPEGVNLHGLSKLDELSVGSFISQTPEVETNAARAVGQVLDIADGVVHVKVIRGRFAANCADGHIHYEGRSFGTPSGVDSPVSMSYKELISATPQTPNWYCCHWWGETIVDFMACLEEHSKLRRGNNDTSYWICAFANSQHDLGMELSENPETSSFRKAMQASHGVLLVLDDRATPFQRIWCDYELYKTVLDSSKNLDIATNTKIGKRRRAQVLAELPGESAIKKTMREASFPIGVLAKGICARLEDGEATVSKDKERILNIMRSEIQRVPSKGEGIAWANETLNAYFAWAAWPQALRHGRVRKFNYDPSVPAVDLPRITAKEEGRTELTISLAHFTEVTDQAIADIVRGLPPNLAELNLSFEGCGHVSDRSLQLLARGFQRFNDLKRLRLDFLGCKHISDVGLEALAKSLPQTLQRLRLDFAKCEDIGHAGPLALEQNLPSSLHDFSITLKGTLVNQNFDSVSAFRDAVSQYVVSSTSMRVVNHFDSRA